MFNIDSRASFEILSRLTYKMKVLSFAISLLLAPAVVSALPAPEADAACTHTYRDGKLTFDIYDASTPWKWVSGSRNDDSSSQCSLTRTSQVRNNYCYKEHFSLKNGILTMMDNPIPRVGDSTLDDKKKPRFLIGASDGALEIADSPPNYGKPEDGFVLCGTRLIYANKNFVCKREGRKVFADESGPQCKERPLAVMDCNQPFTVPEW